MIPVTDLVAAGLLDASRLRHVSGSDADLRDALLRLAAGQPLAAPTRVPATRPAGAPGLFGSPGRPLTGRKWETRTGGRWCIDVPRARGSKQRMQRTFDTEAQADRWHAAALRALRNGDPVPDPDQVAAGAASLRVVVDRDQRSARSAAGSSLLVSRDREAPGVAEGADMTEFERVFDKWAHERYVTFKTAQPERYRDVLAFGSKTIKPFMREHGIESGSQLTRDVYIDFLQGLVSAPPREMPQLVSPILLAPPRSFSVLEASRLFRVGVSTIRRRFDTGKLPNATNDEFGVLQIPYADLEAAGLTKGRLKRGRKAPDGYCADVATDIRWVLNAVLMYGVTTAGWDVFDLTTVPHLPKEDKVQRHPVTFAQAHTLAGHLHIVYQLVLWLLRVLGLRISEAYGIKVGDIYRQGTRGVLKIQRQGGRSFLVLDEDNGEVVEVGEKRKLKTRRSIRGLVMPAQLTDIVQVIIDVFHTDPVTGEVNVQARLIPGLRSKESGGQSGFRAALAEAGRIVGLDVGDDPEAVLLPTPKDMRSSLVTNLCTDAKVDDLIAKRVAGHVPGNDVHSLVCILDDPELKPMEKAARKLEKVMSKACPDGLMAPTTVRCTTGHQSALAPRADQIDAGLIEAGWLLAPQHGEQTMVNTVEAAAMLKLGVGATRRWMRSHPDVQVEGREHQIPIDAVLTRLEFLAARCTLTGLAEETGWPYHGLYQALHHDNPEIEKVDGEIILSAEAEQRLRDMVAAQRELEKTGNKRL